VAVKRRRNSTGTRKERHLTKLQLCGKADRWPNCEGTREKERPLPRETAGAGVGAHAGGHDREREGGIGTATGTVIGTVIGNDTVQETVAILGAKEVGVEAQGEGAAAAAHETATDKSVRRFAFQ
jgi:hypothetical protein